MASRIPAGFSAGRANIRANVVTARMPLDALTRHWRGFGSVYCLELQVSA